MVDCDVPLAAVASVCGSPCSPRTGDREVDGEVARVCSETLLGFEVEGEWEVMEGDETEDVRVFLSEGAELVAFEDEGAEGAADGGGAGATTLANERPLKL